MVKEYINEVAKVGTQLWPKAMELLRGTSVNQQMGDNFADEYGYQNFYRTPRFQQSSPLIVISGHHRIVHLAVEQ